MRRAPSPTAGVMSNAMAPPFPVFGNRTAISPAAGGQCRRSLTHIRVPGQGGNGPEGCRSACCSSTPRRKTRTTPFSAPIKVASSYAQAEPKRCKRSTIARLTRRDRHLAGGRWIRTIGPSHNQRGWGHDLPRKRPAVSRVSAGRRGRGWLLATSRAPEPARWASVGIIIRALYKFGEVWRNGNRAMRQAAGILIEKLQANSAKSLANVSCHERGKKYLPWQNASNAEPPPGIAEPHLAARGRALK